MAYKPTYETKPYEIGIHKRNQGDTGPGFLPDSICCREASSSMMGYFRVNL